VYLLGFDDMVSEADTEAMKPFRVLLEQRRRRAHTALNRVLRSQRFERLLEGWERELARSAADSDTARMPVAPVSRTLLHKAWRRVEKRGRRIDVESPPEALHDLRKRSKELRYLLEFFASLYEQRIHTRVVGELKRLQDNLGEFQDAESQRHLVQRYAEDLRAGGAPAQTLLTMGRMELGLEQRQSAAHTHFAACWKRFDGPQNRRRFTAMVSSV
jgi:CHAD domain-containing protein